MTRRFRCDPCRRWKIRCDEQRPTCGGCARRKIPCSNSGGRTFKFCDWNDKTKGPDAKRADAPSKAPDSPRASKPVDEPGPDDKGSALLLHRPASAQDRLLTRWAAVMAARGAGNDNLDILGIWTSLVPRHAPYSDALAAAASAVVDSRIAFANGSERNVEAAQGSKVVAMGHMRRALSRIKSPVDQAHVLLAIYMLYMSEELLITEHKAFRVHQQGLVQALRQTRGCEDGSLVAQVSRIIFYSIPGLGNNVAVAEGKDSSFDDPWWLARPPPDYDSPPACPGFGQAWETVSRTFILLPRLTRQVREASLSPDDQILRAKATNLAMRLYTSNLEGWIQEITRLSLLRTVPTVEADLKPLLATSYEVASTQLYLLLSRYWTTRTRLYGLIQTLCALPDAESGLFDPAAIHAQDVDSATSIAMLAQHARHTGSAAFPMMLSLDLPVQCAFGTWDRLERRVIAQQQQHRRRRDDGAADCHEATRARCMKRWSVEQFMDITRKWHHPCPWTADSLCARWEVLLDKLSGVPVSFDHEKCIRRN